MPRVRRRNVSSVEGKLSNSLVLNKYILNLFGTNSLSSLSECLKDPALEGYDEENISHFFYALKDHLFVGCSIDETTLRRYDANIYRHTAAINRKRPEKVVWKYFQWLSLLFTEIYLDKYFSNADNLLQELNYFLQNDFNKRENTYHELSEFTPSDLNKLAFWSATGSGKTLLMHVNILQFQHYLAKSKDNINKILLVTPNEGLSRQHLEEFELSGIDAMAFTKQASSGVFSKNCIDVIEITKLADSDGEKTVAVDSFEKNNLVLVDEGHRGSSGDIWKKFRDRLSEKGFAFEYSATFGQAISSVSNVTNRCKMLDEYAKATIFDYSYRYFYLDGYGKDYQILNMSQSWNEDMVDIYLAACILNFYEQQRIYRDGGSSLNPFLLENPLAVFVGSSVTASGSKIGDQDVSDIVRILHFVQKFVSERSRFSSIIHHLLEGTDGLADRNSRSIFSRSFTYLRSLRSETPEQIYDDILNTVFHSNISGAVLHLDNFTGVDGEIGMRIGTSDYFGIINVGDAAGLVKKCSEAGINTMNKDFSGKSLFATINNSDSKINILIGSKKFTEGWSSWRVCTMGLLNVGRSEGSQIIQLFGRGVRLKGYKMSLKRSSALDPSLKPDRIPKNIQIIETLSIFGIKADYMEQFKAILESEGLPGNDSDYEEYTIPVFPMVDLAGKRLKYLKVKDGLDFKKDVKVDLVQGMINQTPVTVDLYPKIETLSSRKYASAGTGTKNNSFLSPLHLQTVDWTKVYFEIQDYKNEKGWYNLSISLSALKEIAASNSWYTLQIPASEMELGNYRRCVSLWQEILIILLKAYVEKAYNNEKSRWMSKNVEVAYLDSGNPNFESEYHVLLHNSLEDFVQKISLLKEELNIPGGFSKTLQIGGDNDFSALYISGHLYQPLLYINEKSLDSSIIEIKPVPLNKGERDFLVDIETFFKSTPAFFDGKELYLLRNKSKKGIGFFDASGFYPDFIIWLVADNHQYVAFVDPKGLRHLRSITDPKIELHKTIKSDIEPQLRDKDISLSSFIVADTPIAPVRHWVEQSDKALIDSEIYDAFSSHNVFFQNEQKETYICSILTQMMHK